MCPALSRLAARGGRLHCADDAQPEPRETGVRRRAAAFVGHRTAGSPHAGNRQLGYSADDAPWRLFGLRRSWHGEERVGPEGSELSEASTSLATVAETLGPRPQRKRRHRLQACGERRSASTAVGAGGLPLPLSNEQPRGHDPGSRVEVVRRGSSRPRRFARRPSVRIAHIGDVDAPEVGRIVRGFRKRGEKNEADLSV